MNKKLLSIGLLLIIMLFAGCGAGVKEWKNGKKSFESENYEEAAIYFSEAIAANPNRAEFYIDYGMALIALGQYEDALKQFDQAYLDKDIIMVKENNKRILRGRGIAYYKLRQYDNAVKRFEEALKISELPKLDTDIMNYMGSALAMTGNYDRAIRIYTELLALNEKDAAAYLNRASCYRSIGDYEKSLADYDQAIAMAPESYDAYFGKYYLLSEHGFESDAEAVLSQAEQIVPATAEDNYNMAKLHYYQGLYDIAMEELNEGYANGFTEAYYYIGEIYRINKDYQKAIFHYDKYINEYETPLPNAYNQIAFCQIKIGEYEKAIKNLEIGISYEQEATLQTLKKNEIIAYESLGRFEEAMAKMEDYLAEYPEDTEAKKEAKFIKTRLIDITQTE